MMPQMPPGAMPPEATQEQMPPQDQVEQQEGGAPEPNEGKLVDLVMDKMQEEGFADNAMTAIEGAKDIGAAVGLMAGLLVSKLYNPGDTDQDVMDAIGEALKEILSMAQDMGVQIDQKAASAAADQAGQMVISIMDQHDESGGQGMPPEGQGMPQDQPPPGMANPYAGMA